MTDLFETAAAEQAIRNVFLRTAVPKGYREVKLPMLESYETYETIQTTQERNRLLKLISRDGAIRVLRPDMTIALMKELAAGASADARDLRCWYMQPVFRQEEDKAGPSERRQAGIELFGEETVGRDAEAILLACKVMMEAGVTDFKLEIGHAGILDEAAQRMKLDENKTRQAAALLQQKNSGEMAGFIAENGVDEATGSFLKYLIGTYGSAANVSTRLGQSSMNSRTDKIFTHLKAVIGLVADQGYGHCLTIDLGMVNDMDYYSGIQFQGFSSSYGKPVLMGGRYDNVSRKFGADLPAVGFACFVDALIAGKS
ncbi:ATP phosphoribosyltransferase regulatory subunit [Sporosarcina trichiuri]|uniref:ATP phosphoribosyltransferase regulatory subunit n=1 Tax=Sporosarcina trichiuri TaxID=3056445 RepID=UPI0025B35ACC|nr:ATP phosphoribosyltransferase regulatory subunit [Sporosarcina sp. 0.2-SM1T-5]WJY27886.1 ATP phosphoribosyltransferase regulatory subunit [Sporosarcina sp. 0.2-SM1T-5]